MDLAELRERLEKASEPDRETDALLWCSVTGETYEPSSVRVDMKRGEYVQRSWNVPAYTESLDAIVSLIEGKLPGWSWHLQAPDAEKSHLPKQEVYSATLSERYPKFGDPLGFGRNPALALCLAFVKAMEAQSNEPTPQPSKEGKGHE